MRTEDFDYDLPSELIASHPLAERSASRMMVINRQEGTIEHRQFCDLRNFVQENDLFVFNDTRVVPARFFSNDKRIELLRVDCADPLHWRCLVRPGKRMKVGRSVEVGPSTGTVTGIDELGYRLISWDQPVDENIHGELALPPYMDRGEEPSDSERYQTVYARQEGAVAAPTAGLHFTPDLVASLPHAFLTLHVGPGTFRPVQVDNPAEHKMHEEAYELSAETADQISHAERVISVGTTVTRVLEHLGRNGPLTAGHGHTNIFIYPPYEFQVVGALLTNFHLPKSTLLMLVSAFANRDLIMEAYEQAVRERYRFFSYGDCMLVL
ncbi:MAG TPA: tRNA preQ1(34) S-adenosylmethionine ribosyltransferase-isomerase QueA [Verrucomicrobiales bacterium]|nr:tRNA preQ1(34) S-adenosylmethionine ribosyltransferase-isomerase QueA [Verrucomicrobiales bacterium]